MELLPRTKGCWSQRTNKPEYCDVDAELDMMKLRDN